MGCYPRHWSHQNNSQPHLIPMRMRARAAATSQKHSQGCTAMLARCTIECMHASTPSAPAGTCLQPPHQPTTHIVVEPAGHVEGPQLQRRKLALQVGHVTANGRTLQTARTICTCTCSRCAPLSAVCVIIRVRKYLHVVVCRRKNAQQRACTEGVQPVSATRPRCCCIPSDTKQVLGLQLQCSVSLTQPQCTCTTPSNNWREITNWYCTFVIASCCVERCAHRDHPAVRRRQRHCCPGGAAGHVLQRMALVKHDTPAGTQQPCNKHIRRSQNET